MTSPGASDGVRPGPRPKPRPGRADRGQRESIAYQALIARLLLEARAARRRSRAPGESRRR